MVIYWISSKLKTSIHQKIVYKTDTESTEWKKIFTNMDVLVSRKYKELVWINKKPRLINLMGKKTSIDTLKKEDIQIANEHNYPANMNNWTT